jgi:L-threonylcarbamoyladenylate synthase
VEIVADDQLVPRANELAAEGKKVAIIGSQWLPVTHANVVLLTAPGDDQRFARALYQLLRRVDELGCEVVVTTLPAEQGLGTAIADRLRRAAGPRNQ